MIRTTAIGAYRKCYECGATSTAVEKCTCKCGSYMYMISYLYGPKPQKNKTKATDL